MKTLLLSLLLTLSSLFSTFGDSPANPIRILVITGGHAYNTEKFNLMLGSLGDNITYQIAELPGAFNMFLPENRSKYDVLVFYHMWQTITAEQSRNLIDCVRKGKPLVVLHHSICAFDNWPDYFNMIGGKYFHKPTTIKDIDYQACTYVEGVHLKIKIVSSKNPVTKGLKDFDLFDEAYKGYYIENGVNPLLTTEDPASNFVIGWTKEYGKARVVTIVNGHEATTFENPNYRKLLRQSIEWVYNEGKISSKPR